MVLFGYMRELALVTPVGCTCCWPACRGRRFGLLHLTGWGLGHTGPGRLAALELAARVPFIGCC